MARIMDKNINSFDFWYAVNNTEVVLEPEGHLETFGSTMLNYYLVTELMDSVGQVRVREGRLEAGQPRIVTPDSYLDTVMDGFGDEARKYIDWLREHERDIRVLQYGYRLRQESFSEYIITDSLDEVVNRVSEEVKAKNDPLSAVVLGVDEPWDVCLVRLFWVVIQKSAVFNIREMQSRRLFEDQGGVPRGVRNSIDKAFLEASRDASLVDALGVRLQMMGLFNEYEDRFFSLVKSRNSKDGRTA
jgi:hypothetical protein